MNSKILFAALLSMAALAAQSAAVTVSNVEELCAAVSRNDTPITIRPGVYDLTGREPATAADGEKAYLLATAAITFKGENDKPWREKTADEETVILCSNASARLVYAYSGAGRWSQFRHITFVGGNAGEKNGGAIFFNGPGSGFATNCVFKDCSAAKGGGSYSISAYGSCYTNCSARSLGGGAYANGIVGYGPTNVVSGCSFIDCSAVGNGGGLYFYEGRAYDTPNSGYVGNCSFLRCSAVNGGGIHEKYAGKVFGCGFTNCTAAVGGALFAENAMDSFATNCTFVGNSATGTVSDAGGGAIAVWNMAVDCHFASNVAVRLGGAAMSVGEMRLCDFTGNRSWNYRGGALDSSCAIDCVFSNNYANADGRGGAIYRSMAKRCLFTGVGDVSSSSCEGCTFDGIVRKLPDGTAGGPNWVLDAVRNGDGKMYATNCLVRNCAVRRIVNVEGNALELVNCTVADNVLLDGDGYGYVIYCNRGTDYVKKADGDYRYFAADCKVVNCIFSENVLDNGKAADLKCLFNTVATDFGIPGLALRSCLYRSVVSGLDGASVAGLLSGDPRFAAGAVKYPGAPYYMPRPSSPARDAGENMAWMADATDIGGFQRIFGGHVDIGCYESTLKGPPFRIMVR